MANTGVALLQRLAANTTKCELGLQCKSVMNGQQQVSHSLHAADVRESENDLITESLMTVVIQASKPGKKPISPPYRVRSKLKLGISTKATCTQMRLVTLQPACTDASDTGSLQHTTWKAGVWCYLPACSCVSNVLAAVYGQS